MITMDEQKKLENYLELRIPVKKDPAWKDWSQQMRSAVKAAGIPVKWQWRFHYHMTILYLDNNACVDQLTPGFAQCLSGISAFPITLDKLDAFTTGNGAEHIICLTTTQLPQQIRSLAQDTRTLADGLKAVYDHRPFKPHITLGRVSTEKATLEQLQAALGTIEPPAFSCLLTEAEHRYRSGDCIKTWKL
jgi:2'-5' RNA ligase